MSNENDNKIVDLRERFAQATAADIGENDNNPVPTDGDGEDTQVYHYEITYRQGDGVVSKDELGVLVVNPIFAGITDVPENGYGIMKFLVPLEQLVSIERLPFEEDDED